MRGAFSLTAVLILSFLSLLAPVPGRADEPLSPLSQPGPWSGISGLIGYGARLWFVSSVKFVDHNSADVYSYDPATGRSRYELHLFSQDAGDPLVAGGLLYWPFEDARFSLGRGEYLVTNGRESRWLSLAQGEVFHAHAMAAHGGALFAATSAWRGGLQRSDDRGATWRVLYEHATPAGRVSRLTTLAVLDGTLYAGVTAYGQNGVTLLRMAGDSLGPVPGWPRGDAVTAMTPHGRWLYAVHTAGGATTVLRTDGRSVERVAGLDGQGVRALAAGPDALWAVSARDGAGALWRSADGLTWSLEQRFADAEPLAVTVYAGRVYVGTTGAGGRGTLWGPRAPAPAAPPAAPASLPAPPRPPFRTDLAAALQTLDAALADPASYAAHGAGLRAALEPLAEGGLAQAGVELGRRLDGPFPELRVRLFGGNLTVPAVKMARWSLLRAMALNGHGRVPPALLAEPWTEHPNRPEKYFEPAPAAAWAAAQLRQSDPETLGALVGRLGAADQPRWLDGDFVGALTALTGERFGYDVGAWREWWARRTRPH